MPTSEFNVLPGSKLIGMTIKEVEKKYGVRISEVRSELIPDKLSEVRDDFIANPCMFCGAEKIRKANILHCPKCTTMKID